MVSYVGTGINNAHLDVLTDHIKQKFLLPEYAAWNLFDQYFQYARIRTMGVAILSAPPLGDPTTLDNRVGRISQIAEASVSDNRVLIGKLMNEKVFRENLAFVQIFRDHRFDQQVLAYYMDPAGDGGDAHVQQWIPLLKKAAVASMWSKKLLPKARAAVIRVVCSEAFRNLSLENRSKPEERRKLWLSFAKDRLNLYWFMYDYEHFMDLRFVLGPRHPTQSTVQEAHQKVLVEKLVASMELMFTMSIDIAPPESATSAWPGSSSETILAKWEAESGEGNVLTAQLALPMGNFAIHRHTFRKTPIKKADPTINNPDYAMSATYGAAEMPLPNNVV